VSTYYMAKEKYPPLLSYGLQVGAACVVGAAASVRRGANIIDMATKHTYTHSLSSDLQGEKNRNKAKRSRLKTQTKKKKKKNHAECAIRCECTWGDE
jgi:ABC-type oligopeptide transport system ATPase subunit